MNDSHYVHRNSGRRSSGTNRTSSGRNNGRRVLSEQEKEAVRRRHRERMRRKKRQAAMIQALVILLIIAAAVIFFVFKGFGFVFGKITESRQKAIAAQQFQIHTTEAAQTSSQVPETTTIEPTTTVPETTMDPNLVLSNGRYLDITRPMVALTFDDGPRADVGNRIMDYLEAVDGRGTFFMVGQLVREFPDEVKRMAENGHEVANHSWDHDIHLSRESSDYILSEFSKTDDAISSVCGVVPEVYRLPGGNISDTVNSTLSKPLIYWSIDTLDWKTKDPDKTFETVKAEVTDGSIVLMHEIYEATGKACEQMIPWLHDQGYQLVTISELLTYRSNNARTGNKGQIFCFPPVETTASDSSS